MNRSVIGLVLVVMFAAGASAQICDPGLVFLKNDTLPQVPTGTIAASVIQGLCDGEMMGAVFDVSGLGNAVIVRKAAGAFLNGGGANGVSAVVNLRIYDGVQFVGGTPVLGPQLLDWAAATGSNIQFNSHAINEHDLAAQAVTITSGKLVVAWEMLINGDPSGTCAGGYPSNFGTDYAGGGFIPPCTTIPQQNLIFIQGQGWRDASTAQVSGVSICGGLINAFNGNWIIRACVEPVVNPLTIGFLPAANHSVSLGFPTLVQFSVDVANNPGFVGQQFIPLISGTLGSTPVGAMTLPVAVDFVANAYLTNPTVKSYFDLTPPATNYIGTVPSNGIATGVIQIPNTLSLPFSVPLYFTFLTLQGATVTGVADATTLTLDP